MERFRMGKSGQGLVEFALVVPLLLFLFFGIVEFGRAWMTRNVMTGAAREAVRVAVVQTDFPTADNVARTRAGALLNAGGISGAVITVTQIDSPEPMVEVQISYVFPAIFGGFIPGLNGMSLSTETTMRRERF